MKSTPSNRDRTALPTKVLDCVCSSDYQDKKYGKYMRLHNPCAKGWRCTVCGRETEIK